MSEREIKFRGKRVTNGEWVYGGYYHDGLFPFIITTEDDKYIFHGVLPETVGQATGLKDKNDKEPREIYDGDAYRGAESGILLVVEFVEGEFILTKKVDRSPYRVKHCGLHYAIGNLSINYEGNIHENLEIVISK